MSDDESEFELSEKESAADSSELSESEDTVDPDEAHMQVIVRTETGGNAPPLCTTGLELSCVACVFRVGEDAYRCGGPNGRRPKGLCPFQKANLRPCAFGAALGRCLSPLWRSR